MMNKRFSKRAAICALVSLAVLCCALPAFAQQQLVSDELLNWRQALEEALPALCERAPEGIFDDEHEAWSFACPFGFVLSDHAKAFEGTISQVEIINSALACPRGVRVGDSLAQVLVAYGCDESDISQGASCVTLYTDASSLSWGWLLRGSEEDCLQFAAPAAAEGMEGYVWDLNIRYLISDGVVSSIVADGFAQGIPLAEAQANFSAADEAFLHPVQSAAASSLSQGPAFEAADLVFSGLDFSSLTLDSLLSVLGEPVQTEDDTQGVRNCVFDGVLAECRLEDEIWKVNALVVTSPSFSGPRGVSPGVSAASVLEAFGGYQLPEDSTLLYEDLSSGSWGQYTLEGDQSSVTYGVTLEDSHRYVLTVTFSQGAVTEYLMYHE